MDTLGYLMSGRTTILIAHRLSTAMHCDQIAVLEAGFLSSSTPHVFVYISQQREAQWAYTRYSRDIHVVYT